MASTVSVNNTPSLFSGLIAAGSGALLFGLSLPIAAFAGILAAFTASNESTVVTEADGVVLTFTANTVIVARPGNTPVAYNLQDVADAIDAAGAFPTTVGSAVGVATGLTNSADDTSLIASVINAGATLLGS